MIRFSDPALGWATGDQDMFTSLASTALKEGINEWCQQPGIGVSVCVCVCIEPLSEMKDLRFRLSLASHEALSG